MYLLKYLPTDGTVCRISCPKKNSNEFHQSTTGLQMMPTAHHFDPTIELQTVPINYIPTAPLHTFFNLGTI